jgi:hypothetical protein
MEDRRLTVREIANDIGISDSSAHAIFTDDLGMRRVAAKFVPKLLSCEQEELRLDVAQDMLECRKPTEPYELFHSGYHQAFGKTWCSSAVQRVPSLHTK